MRQQRYAWPTLFSALLLFRASSATLYVSLNSTNPVPPYADWSTAATNIQDAVSVAATNDMVVVTNGAYPGGVAVTNPLTLLSVNGPQYTAIDGGGTNQCISLTSNTILVGFTLTNGSAGDGGGAYGGTLSNCTLTGNSASYGGGAAHATLNNCVLISNSTSFVGGGASSCTLNNCTLGGNYGSYHISVSDTYGGGASGCTLNNCLLTNNTCGQNGGGAWRSTLNHCVLIGNSATNHGGGADEATLNNCTLTGNSALTGGGAYDATLNNCTLMGNSAKFGGGAGSSVFTTNFNNCIIYYNAAPNGANYYRGTPNYCCTTPMPGTGSGNITVEPLLVNLAGGDFHLQSNSPCINSGNDVYTTGAIDLDGNPRIVAGTVDIGAYEYQTPVSKISYAWLQQYGLPIDTNTDATDSDGDGLNNYQEWIAGNNPTNALSVLAMLQPVPTNGPTGLVVSWESVNNRTYYLQSSTNLAAQPAFTTIQSNIIGQVGITGYMDTNAVGQGPYFYRVGVQ